MSLTNGQYTYVALHMDTGEAFEMDEKYRDKVEYEMAVMPIDGYITIHMTGEDGYPYSVTFDNRMNMVYEPERIITNELVHDYVIEETSCGISLARDLNNKQVYLNEKREPITINFDSAVEVNYFE